MPRNKVDTLYLPERINALLGKNEAPLPMEKSSIREALVRPEEELQDTREIIARKRKELDDLIWYEETLELEMAPYQALLSPFLQIPNEILGMILLACLPDEHTPVVDIHQPPLLLTRISSRLRRVALSTPGLWTAINIPIVSPCLTGVDDGRDLSRIADSRITMRKYTTAVNQWLGRTGACAVEICIHEFGNYSACCDVEGIFETLIALAGQWKTISLHCSGYSIQKFCAMLGKSYSRFDFPLLQRLSLHISGQNHLLEESPQEKFNHTSHLPHASNLHSIRLVLPEDNYEGYHCQWSRLTYLSLGSASHPASLNSIIKILKFCANLVNCKLHVAMDTTDLRLHLPYLRVFSLFLTEEAWFDAAIYHPELLLNAVSLCNNLDMPLLERVTYDASVNFLPLLGLLQCLGDHITHLSVTRFEVPTELIECLKACPLLVSLDVSRPDGIPEATERQDHHRRKLARWDHPLMSWDTAGDKLLRYLMRAGDIDDKIQTQLCPHLEHLAYHISDGPMSCEGIKGFILDKSQDREGARLKRFSAVVRGGWESIEWLRRSVEKQLLAGLNLRLLPRRAASYKYMEHSAHPSMKQLKWWDDEHSDNANQ